MPFDQGLLIPGDWPHAVNFGVDEDQRIRTYCELFNVEPGWWWSFRPGYVPALENNMLMPWWGAVERKGSVLAVLDEDAWADSHLVVKHPSGGPSEWRLLWLPCRGRLS